MRTSKYKQMQKLRPKFEGIRYNKEVVPETLIQRIFEPFLKCKKKKYLMNLLQHQV
jgi:hypothetical protein